MIPMRPVTGTTEQWEAVKGKLILMDGEFGIEVVTDSNGNTYRNLRQGNGSDDFFDLPVIVNNEKYAELSTKADTVVTLAAQVQTNATNASKAATNAANSATAASTSATNAATSATSASTSATNAATSEANAKAYAEQAQATTGIDVGSTTKTGIVKLTSASDVTDTTGLAVAATELNPDIDGTIAQKIAQFGDDDTTLEDTFYEYYTKVGTSSDTDATAMTTSDVTDAINTEWNGESTTDETAMSSSDVTESVETEWNGESSDDATALSASDISNITT